MSLENPNSLPFNDPDTNTKTALVTGASSGIGWYTTLHLYMHGWQVFLGVRNVLKGQKAIDDIKTEAEKRRRNGSVSNTAKFGQLALVQMDLLDIKSLDKVEAQLQHTGKLDLLVHNAGIMAVPFEISQDGWEVQMQTNYVAPFVLTDRLLSLLQKAPKPRIVYLSSIGHHFATRPAPLDTRQDGFPGLYYGFVRYGYSKTAGMQLMNQLAKDYPQILSLSVHPGFVMETELYRHWNSLPLVGPLFNLGFRSFGVVFGVSKEEGCYSTLVAALSPDLTAPADSGEFLWTKGSQGNPSSVVKNEQYALENWNWTVSEMEQKSVRVRHFQYKR
ncbi:putative oxidoreductase ENV9 [Yarrowia sp. C11]|nr:putative oxidoreductase ENV9 [Yarrowia sp. C11]KAG5370615.1 putative oxidoreductase ENV9 [Yarrowia sp. E02]